MEEITAKEPLDATEKWNNILNLMEDFLYDTNGIVTVAASDESLDSYFFDIDAIVDILKELADFQKMFGLTEVQIADLKQLKEEFLVIATEENNVTTMYQDIKRVYENIEKY